MDMISTMLPGRSLLLFLCACLLGAAPACSHDGALEIELDVETSEAELSPLRNPSISSFQLTLATTGAGREQLDRTYLSGMNRLGFGEIPTGTYASAAVSAIAFSGALVAYGEHRNRFRVESSDSTRIRIPLRFPFVYAAGGTELPAVHPELDQAAISVTDLMVGLPADITSATAVSPDGTRLVVLTVNASGAVKFWYYLTANHQRLVEFQMTRPDRVSSVTFSPNGNTLLLLSTEGDWVAFLNLPEFLSGESRAGSFHYQEVERPLAAGFLSDDSAVVLGSADYRHDTCTPSPAGSSLTWFLISRPLKDDNDVSVTGTTALASYTADLAVDRSANRVFLAHPCTTEVSSMTPGTAGPSVVLGLLNLSPCLRPVKLLADDTALTVACVTTADTVSPTWSAAKLLLQRFNLTPQLTPNARTLVMDYPSEPINYASHDTDPDIPVGTSVLILQAPERVLPRHLGRSAKGNRLVLVAEAYYQSPDVYIGSSTLAVTRSKSHSIVFVDPRLGRLDRRVRTSCFEVDNHLDDTPPEGGFSNTYCTDNQGSIETTRVSFIPTQLSIMYGTP